jgi:hypothetical protein
MIASIQLIFGILFSIKLLFALVFVVAGGGAILVAYKKWAWVMKIIVGQERMQSLGNKTIGLGFYILGGTLILLALLLLS